MMVGEIERLDVLRVFPEVLLHLVWSGYACHQQHVDILESQGVQTSPLVPVEGL